MVIERHPEQDETWSFDIETHNYDDKDGHSILMIQSAPKVAGYWVLPISTNTKNNLGIYLYLHDDGKIERVTIREDEGDEVVVIKPADKEIK